MNCPKCLSEDILMRYRTSRGVVEEHFVCQCQRCEYTFATEVAKPQSKLPPAWDKPTPPQMLKRLEVHTGIVTESSNVWNKQWLKGLDQFVRAIVKEERGVQ